MAHALLTTMAKQPRMVCRLCEEANRLTFEHAPPRSSGNTDPVLAYTLESVMRGFQGPRKFRRGLGAFGLCEGCNNGTGQRYVPWFSQWVEQIREHTRRASVLPRVFCTFTIRPLEVAKQLAVMLLAINPYEVTNNDACRSLRQLVMNPEHSGRPRGIRFCAYIADGREPRLAHYAGLVWVAGVKNVMCWGEIALPPIGIVAVHDDESCRRITTRFGMADVTGFFDSPAGLARPVHMYLPRLNPVGAAPLDYAGYTDSPTYSLEHESR